MSVKIIIIIAFIGIAVSAWRFGLFTYKEASLPKVTEFQTTPVPSPLLPAKQSSTPSEEGTKSATIKILDAPTYTTKNQSLKITWFIDAPKIATISRTAIHYGMLSRPFVKLPSDYPEKSEILKGAIPASFSASLRFPNIGLYYFRAHAIFEEENIWSDERTIRVFEATDAAAVKPSL